MSAIRISTFSADDDDELDLQPTPPQSGPALFVKRLGPNEKIEVVIYSHEILGLNVHFGPNSKRSSAHYRNREKCPGCLAKVPMRWKGFLHCRGGNPPQTIFLELTPSSANALNAQRGTNPSLRGFQIQAKRSASANGRLLVSLVKIHTTTDGWPEPLDPLETLRALWGIADKPKHPNFGGDDVAGLDG